MRSRTFPRRVRRQDGVWSLAVRGIHVATFQAEGEALGLSVHDGVRSLTVDGRPGFGSIPELAAIGEREGASYVVRATRLDGDLWEVSADPL